MAKTKDYEDYIDWCYDNGYDPADYDSYDDYIKDVLGDVPPINFNRWETDSKKQLTSELSDFFNEQKEWVSGTAEQRKKEIEPIKELKESRKVKATIFQFESALSRGTRRKAKAAGRKDWKEQKISKTDQKLIKSIQKKILTGEKPTKTERKLIGSGKFHRAHEIRRKDNVDMSTALKRVNREWKL